MLRASATRALRQCGKKRNLGDIKRSPIAPSAPSAAASLCDIRRGSFQQWSSSSSASSTLTAANRYYVTPRRPTSRAARCLTSNTITPRDSSWSQIGRDGSGKEPCRHSSGSTISRIINNQAAVGPTSSSSSSSLLSINLDIISSFDRRQQQRYHSTNAAKESATSVSASDVTTNLEDKEDEKKIDSNNYKNDKVDSSSVKSTTTTTTPTTSSTTPSHSSNSSSTLTKASNAVTLALQTIITFIAKMPSVLLYYLTHPSSLRAKLVELKALAVKEAQHFWMGCKLLAADVRTARHILGRTLRGSTLSRRERKQLLRTATDVFRLVPMSIFVLVPFMEFALPFALKLFPNMLPSTFRDGLKEEEKMKGELQMRISMAGFFQDTLTELAKEQKKIAETRKHNASEASDAETIELARKEASSASAFLSFLKKARTGEAIPPDVIIKFAKMVEDSLMLDNLGRMQLINLCKYMGISPYGSNDLLRFYLRHKIRVLKDDDQRITWEGIDTLTKTELREACRERGMRSTGLSKDAYRAALQQWLDLSVLKNVPISLLIMSRTFYLHDEMVGGDSPSESGIDDGSKGVTGLADVMSGIDKEVLNEIVLEMASSEEKSTNADIRKIQMEVLEHQNELIEEEQQERDVAAKEKEEKQKEKATKVADEQAQQADTVEASSVSDVSTTKEEAMDEKTALSEEDVSTDDKAFASSTLESPISQNADEKVASKEEATASEDEQTELSTEEIDAISQLTSPDPVQKEREELQKIKDAMVEVEEPPSTSTDEQPSDIAVDEGEVQREQAAEAVLEMSSSISPCEPIRTEEAEGEAVETIKELEDAIEKEAQEANVISMDGGVEGKKTTKDDEDAVSPSDEGVGDAKLQKAIDRLKYRVESMVGKIETQLTDVEVKIGNKFHLLDQDGDGVLTMAEMAQVLQTVLKRELTSEEAMAIAAGIDTNKDGFFTIAELAQWCESNTIVKLAEEGREKDLDNMITERVQERRKLKEEDEEWTGM